MATFAKQPCGAGSMTENARVLQKRLLLLIKRGAWPYYAAIIIVVFLFWLYRMLDGD
jgi:hypothetical protein